MLVPYRESDSKGYYDEYFKAQAGGMPVFSGRPVMGGAGIGSVLSGLLRASTPFLKKGAKALGKRVLILVKRCCMPTARPRPRAEW